MSWSPYLPGTNELRATFLLRLIEYRDGVNASNSSLFISRLREIAEYDIFTKRQLARIFGKSEKAMVKLFKVNDIPQPTRHGADFNPTTLETMLLQVTRRMNGWHPLPEITEQLTMHIGPTLLSILAGIPRLTYYSAKKRRENRGTAV